MFKEPLFFKSIYLSKTNIPPSLNQKQSRESLLKIRLLESYPFLYNNKL